MSGDVVIRADSIGKKYLIGHQTEQHAKESLREAIGRKARRSGEAIKRILRGNVSVANGPTEEFWALKDVSFEIERGQIVGLIGRNGAGKSTLLKILSRITEPTEGRIALSGRVASLLEVGTGFHGELTGRENIYLNGAILGMAQAEIRRKFDEIVDFAEVEKFLDTPVKWYSSGMYVRLAFAVAAHLEPEILIVDEVLAVGDAAFQRKSLGKMGDVARSGRTVLFVSHNLGAVRNLCSHAFLFESGKIKHRGTVEDTLAIYEASVNAGYSALSEVQFNGDLADHIRFEKIIYKQDGIIVDVLDPLVESVLELHGFTSRDLSQCEMKIAISRDGLHIGSCYDSADFAPLRRGSFTSIFRFPADVFKPGRYVIGVGAAAQGGGWLWGSEVSIMNCTVNLGGRSIDRSLGLIGISHAGERSQ